MKNKILASLGRGIGSFLGLPTLEQLGLPVATLPTASLPLGEVQLPGSRPVTLVTAPAQPARPAAPVAGGPGTLGRGKSLAELGIHLTPEIMADAVVRYQAKNGTRPAAARPVPRAKAAPAPALEDDNQTATPPAPADPEQDPSLDSIISQLLDLIMQLKKSQQVTADDDSETQAALGLMAKGKKLSASRALMAVTKKMCERPKLSPTARIARGFSGDDSVKAIQACLHPRTTSAVRASFALASVAGGPAQPAVPGSRDRVQALRAEIAQLDREQRKQFSNERHARHSALSRELKAELRKFHVR